jgi:LPS sulfotransferase NodH
VVVYEELDARPFEVTTRVLGFLGAGPPETVLRTWSTRQRDELNDEWIARYEATRAERAARRERRP